MSLSLLRESGRVLACPPVVPGHLLWEGNRRDLIYMILFTRYLHYSFSRLPSHKEWQHQLVQQVPQNDISLHSSDKALSSSRNYEGTNERKQSSHFDQSHYISLTMVFSVLIYLIITVICSCFGWTNNFVPEGIGSQRILLFYFELLLSYTVLREDIWLKTAGRWGAGARFLKALREHCLHAYCKWWQWKPIVNGLHQLHIV